MINKMGNNGGRIRGFEPYVRIDCVFVRGTSIAAAAVDRND